MIVLPDWQRRPAHQIVGEKLRINILSSTPSTGHFLEGDAINAVRIHKDNIIPSRCWRWLRVAAVPGRWKAAQVYQLTA